MSTSPLVVEATRFLLSHLGALERLLTWHVPDGTGRCRGCTTPGYGTPHDRWPCAPALLAAAAHRATDRA